MDDIVSTRSVRPKAISAADEARRRRALRQADANNRLEGIFRDPATDAIFEASVRGDIKVTDVVPYLKARLGLR